MLHPVDEAQIRRIKHRQTGGIPYIQTVLVDNRRSCTGTAKSVSAFLFTYNLTLSTAKASIRGIIFHLIESAIGVCKINAFSVISY